MQNTPYTEFVNYMVAKRDIKNKEKVYLKHWLKRSLTQYMEVLSDGTLSTDLNVLQVIG